MSRISDTATCETTSTLRNRCRPLPSAILRPPSRSTSFKSVREARSAGIRPTNKPVPSAIAAI